jgi:hypothetical protein
LPLAWSQSWLRASGVAAVFLVWPRTRVLEAGQDILPEDGGEDIFDLAGQERDLHFTIGLLFQ